MQRLIVGMFVITVLLSGCVGGNVRGPIDEMTTDEPGKTAFDFPEAFTETPLIVVSEEPTAIELTAAQRLAAIIRSEVGETAPVVQISNLTDSQQKESLIFVGQTANIGSDKVSRSINKSDGVSNLQSREGRVVVTENPWNESRTLLLVEGKDAFGLWAAADALHGVQQPVSNMTVTFETLSDQELDRVRATETIGGRLPRQLYIKRAYFTHGPEAVNGTYLASAGPFQLVFQQVTIYSNEKFNASEITALRAHGIRITQDSWISSGNGGSYAAAVPLDELDRVANNTHVTRIETREETTSTTTTA